MTVQDFYDRIGQDYMEVYERMTGNEALIRRFLKQFCEDETFPALEQAVRDGDVRQIFLEAHTLKGLSANLGLRPLCEKVCVLVELTRNAGNGADPENETVDRGQILEAFAGIREVWQGIVTQIAEIEP